MMDAEKVSAEKLLEKEIRRACVDALQGGMTVANVMGHLLHAAFNVDRVGQASAAAKAQQATAIVAASILPPSLDGKN